ncbi:MAG: metallopeptidase family protein [bacterium]|nr:metallopeptidase family protein [bacterium]
MTQREFETIVADIGLSAVPEKLRDRIKNVAFIIEYEPSKETRKKQGLRHNQTLLGLYHGIPQSVRGVNYGVGNVLPDTITLYQKPIEEAGGGDPVKIREVIKNTIWHEVAHHFGLDHKEIAKRERKV